MYISFPQIISCIERPRMLRVSDSAGPVGDSLYNAAHRVAFPIVLQGRHPGTVISELNTWPTLPPVGAQDIPLSLTVNLSNRASGSKRVFISFWSRPSFCRIFYFTQSQILFHRTIMLAKGGRNKKKGLRASGNPLISLVGTLRFELLTFTVSGEWSTFGQHLAKYIPLFQSFSLLFGYLIR